ncbi:MAG: HlyC/CorC family transporter [Spirochaetales bacterium]|nr:HlyC/CorC family transporter [Spirochaetales bacterium]
MIQGVVELGDTTVKEAIVPRIDVVFLPVTLSFSELMDKITQSGHSRFPVYQETIDNVVGILYVKDLLRDLEKNNWKIPENLDLKALVRKAFFVPETKKLDGLLKEFKRRRVHIAVAVDEYGGVSGIVCLEDIIEEIIGDIQDEFDEAAELILEIGEKTFLCDARVAIDELNETLGLSLPNDNFDTLGGFVFDLFGKIPVRYEKVSFGHADFIIQSMEGYKIKSVKILLKETEDA